MHGLVSFSIAAKFDFLFADREIAVVELLGNGVKAVAVIEIDQAALAVFDLVKRRGFLELPAQVCESVVAPNLFQTKGLSLRFVPGKVKMERVWILALILLLGSG